MTLRPAPQKELTRLHGRLEESRGTHGQVHYSSVGGQIVDVNHPVALFEQRRFLDHVPNRHSYCSRPGAGGEINDIAAALQFDPAPQLHGAVKAVDERRPLHCPANFNVAALVGEINQATADLNARNIFAKVNRAIHLLVSCSCPEPETDSGLTNVRSNSCGLLTAVVSVPLLPSAPNLRYAA